MPNGTYGRKKNFCDTLPLKHWFFFLFIWNQTFHYPRLASQCLAQKSLPCHYNPDADATTVGSNKLESSETFLQCAHTVHCEHCALWTLCTLWTLYTLCTVHWEVRGGDSWLQSWLHLFTLSTGSLTNRYNVPEKRLNEQLRGADRWLQSWLPLTHILLTESTITFLFANL